MCHNGGPGPALHGPVPANRRTWLAQPCVREATAPGPPGGPAAAGHALKRALDPAEPDGTMTAFPLPAPGRPERHARQRTAHAALAGRHPQPAGRPGSRPAAGPRRLLEALSGSEIRVLRYLPANLCGAQRVPAPGHSTSSKAYINDWFCSSRIGQYAHLQQCTRLTIRALIIGDRAARWAKRRITFSDRP